MPEDKGNYDQYFLQLLLSLQAGAMQQMGKMVSPVSGKVERNMELARHTIDILGMLESKTKGNLSVEESRLLGHILYELRMNFVDESKKDDASKTSGQVEPEQKNSADDKSEAER